MDYSPRLWGRSGWTFLEFIALGYPDYPTKEDKEHYKELYYNLKYTIPCKECRDNYNMHIKETPIDIYLKSSYSLYEWVIIMRNKVNRLLKNPHIDHEKERMKSFKRNIEITNGKPCCGKGKGKILNSEPIKLREERLESLQKNIRSKKNELRKVKEQRELKKKRRKDKG